MSAQAAAAQLGLLDFLKSKLTVSTLEDLVKRLVTAAEIQIPGASGAEKKAWCVKQALTLLEAFDDRIPVLGKFLDMPLADWLEEWAIGMTVEWAWGVVFGNTTPPVKPAA